MPSDAAESPPDYSVDLLGAIADPKGSEQGNRVNGNADGSGDPRGKKKLLFAAEGCSGKD
jgi:hypothetical protein